VHKSADGKTEEARVYEYTGNNHRYHFWNTYVLMGDHIHRITPSI
jgi:hypothetical protein